MPNSVRQDGEWNEYARLVLAELERHNKLLAKMDEKLDSIKIEQAIYDREITAIKGEIVDIKAAISRHNDRLVVMENSDLADKAIKKYKKWIIGAVFSMLISVAIPVTDLILKLGEGAG